jgi:transposase
MNIHKNAPLTPKGREAMVRSVVEGGLSKADAAYQFNTTSKTVAKWVKRFRAEGAPNEPTRQRYKRMEAAWRALADEQDWLDGEPSLVRKGDG